MLEKPDLSDEKLSTCLQNAYGLRVMQIAFLPLGADPNTAVYRAVTADSTAYFVKLRSGVFDELSVLLPKWFSEQGIAHIIPPLATQTGQLWATFGAYTVILYPFVEGRNGYEVTVTDRHWREFGTVLKQIHTAAVPSVLMQRLPQERYSAQGRESIKRVLAQIDDAVFTDPVAVDLAAFLKGKRAAILDLVERAEQRAQALQASAPPLIVCHSDIHAANLLIDANDMLYIVDWDNPILAPKERDLMFIGGGQFGNRRTAQEEESLFYQAYGQTQLDPVALAYYRYERIVQDIAIFCEQLLLSTEGGEDREQSLYYLKSNFLPNNTIEIAYRADTTQNDSIPLRGDP